MNLIQKRRSKPDFAEQSKAQEEVRRQIALAVSITKRKTEAEVRTEVMDALSQITGNG